MADTPTTPESLPEAIKKILCHWYRSGSTDPAEWCGCKGQCVADINLDKLFPGGDDVALKIIDLLPVVPAGADGDVIERAAEAIFNYDESLNLRMEKELRQIIGKKETWQQIKDRHPDVAEGYRHRARAAIACATVQP